jgi:hypothetical protein
MNELAKLISKTIHTTATICSTEDFVQISGESSSITVAIGKKNTIAITLPAKEISIACPMIRR